MGTLGVNDSCHCRQRATPMFHPWYATQTATTDQKLGCKERTVAGAQCVRRQKHTRCTVLTSGVHEGKENKVYSMLRTDCTAMHLV
jgi:hypothetical protein